MQFSVLYVAIILVFMLVALMREYLRPGLILFTAVVLFLVSGIITPEEAVKGFSNKGMITVALLYLVSEGVIVRNRTRVQLCQNCLRITIGSHSESWSSSPQ